MTEPENEKPPRVGGRFLLRAGFAGLFVVFCVAAATATGTLLQVKNVTDTFHKFGHVAKFRKATITRADAGSAQTILLVGSDHRFGHSRTDARSDTLMLLRLDPDQRAISALSIPRDLAVEIPGHGLSKINAAYGEGGLDLTTRTVEKLLSAPGRPFRVNHAITATFTGFKQVVDRLHCVYVDVDRRYYHSNAGLPPSQQYSEINIQPGYQRLCGTKGLAYVRYRHGDNDLVRAARQQAFVSDLKAQAGGSNLLGKLKSLVKIFAKTTETDGDLQSSTGLLRLIDLLVFSQHHAIVSIHFPAAFVNVSTGASPTGVVGNTASLGDYVTASPSQIAAVIHHFMHADRYGPKKRAVKPHAARKRHGQKHHRRSARTAASYGLVDSLSNGAALAKAALQKRHLAFPMFVPAWLTAHGVYPTDMPVAPMPRVYTIKSRSGHAYRAYRFVLVENESEGRYYGVEGTGWKDPPLLDAKSTPYRVAGRTLQLIGDGSHLRYVVWKTKKGVYWVANTLTLDLSNQQMIGIARSLTRVRR